MAIDSYSTLQTAVDNWLDRGDLSARVPEFISLAEARIARKLRVRAVEERSTTPLVAAQEYYSLPTDFLRARSVKINSNPVRVLQYKTPTQLSEVFPNSTVGDSCYYTIIGEEIQLKPSPNSTDTLEVAYFKKLPALSDSNTTNWLTANAPDLLLFGSLMEAEAYLVNDPRIGTWKGAFDTSMDEWNKQEERARFSGHALSSAVSSNP
jgi:hypothetical protein